MADVFVSYSRNDKKVAEQVAGALEAAGISCWLDQHIPGGSTFTDVTEKELLEAASVVVLWSEASVKSNWVKDEAQVGREQGKLVPLTIDGTLPPLGFRQIQAIDFTNWPKEKAPLEALTSALAPLMGGERPAPSSPAPAPAPEPAKRKPLILAAIAAIAMALAGGGYWAMGRLADAPEAQATEPFALAILPFTVTGDASEREQQLGAGLAEVLNTSLSGLPRLAITSNLSTAQLMDGGKSIAEIGERLKVGHVVEGQVRFEGGDAILTLALIEAATSRKIWSDTFREDRRVIGLLVYRSTTELTSVLGSRFGVGQVRLADHSNVEQSAYEAYLRGTQLLWARINPGNRARAYVELTRATRLAPDFADAHAALAFLVVMSGPDAFSLSFAEWQEVAEEATRRALALDPDNLLAQVASHHMPIIYGGDIASAITDLEQLVQDHPDYAPSHYVLANALAAVGEHRRAVVHYREALRIDPVSAHHNLLYSHSLLALGDYPELRQRAMECTNCLDALDFWFRGLVWLADERQFAQDFERLFERVTAEGMDIETIEEWRRITVAIRERRRFTWGTVLPADNIFAALGYGTVGDYQSALSELDRYPVEVMSENTMVLLLDTPRDELPKSVRADPRYHALFATPGIQSIIAERRRRGHTRNLPVLPVKPYTEP